MNPIFRIKIIHGVLTFKSPDLFKEFLLTLKHNWPYELIVRPIIKKRTDRQNRYYFGVVLPMITEEIAGSQVAAEKEEVHRLLARHFLGTSEDIEGPFIGGIAFLKTPSTTSLNTVEFTEYIEAVRKWAAEFLNLDIPDPKRVD